MEVEKMKILFQGDSITDAGRDRGDIHNLGNGYPKYAAAALQQAHPEIELYDPDLTHPSYAGSCLAAMTHYRTLFGQVPADLSCFSLSEDVKQVFFQTLTSVFEK
mgnify:CR=1 FL=1